MSELRDSTVHMVDVGEKAVTLRKAKASGVLAVSPTQVEALSKGEVAKGDWQSVAKLGGVMAAKRCSESLPLCHQIGLDSVEVTVTLDAVQREVHVSCEVSAHAKTGVEMEALCGVTTALLCVYDMIKSLDKGARMVGVGLDLKSGGRSGHWTRS